MHKTTLRILTALSVLFVISGGCASVDNGPVRVENYTETIRVACIGDSITFGSGIESRDTYSYPAQLGEMLGDDWDVRNFGVSGATMLKVSNKPYWKERAFASAIAFAPHVVVIKLGTNDSKNHWDADNYEADYAEMIDAFAALGTKPRIWLCLPVPVYQDKWQIRESVVSEEVIPILKKIAREKNLPVIDLYEALTDAEDLFPDKIHPNAKGAKLMAEEIKAALTGN